MAVRELSATPSMARMFGRASLAMIPGASRLPFVSGGGGADPELPVLADRAGSPLQPDRSAPADTGVGAPVAGGVGRDDRAAFARDPVLDPDRGAGRRRARLGRGFDKPPDGQRRIAR